jgi:hypothetical protein
LWRSPGAAAEAPAAPAGPAPAFPVVFGPPPLRHSRTERAAGGSSATVPGVPGVPSLPSAPATLGPVTLPLRSVRAAIAPLGPGVPSVPAGSQVPSRGSQAPLGCDNPFALPLRSGMSSLLVAVPLDALLLYSAVAPLFAGAHVLPAPAPASVPAGHSVLSCAVPVAAATTAAVEEEEDVMALGHGRCSRRSRASGARPAASCPAASAATRAT